MSKKDIKKKHSGNKSAELKQKKKIVELVYTIQPGEKFKYILWLPVLATIVAGIYFIYYSFEKNGYFGFPLDDPWIHLTFAKNFIEYGSFSYFKNEIVTSGSTSPVYTLLLSFLYIFIKNEFVISYLPGIVFGALFIYLMTKISSIQFKNSLLLTVITALLVALQPKLNLINVSGMETSMFIFFIAGSFYSYQTRKIIPLGIFLGLTIWCRPDGFVLWIAIALDFFLQQNYFLKTTKSEELISRKEISTAFSIAFLFVALYFVFNYLLSGSFLPNTFKAKLEYYQNNDRMQFLQNDVVKYFSESEFILTWIPFLIGVIGIIRSFLKRERNTLVVYLLFIIGLVAAYYIKLPFAHRFGRYLMPVIPFYILIAVWGVKIVIDFMYEKMAKGKSQLPNMIFIVYLIASLVLVINANSGSISENTILCKYHNDRQVAAGKWLKENTNENTIVAAHDVGAIAYYGERKIIDMAGLVTPELIVHLNDRLYSEYLNKYLVESKVDYLITLRNWFEVVNDLPVFAPVNEMEYLEIFKYDPQKTHIQPKEVSQLNQAAIQMLQNGNASNAVSYLNQSLILDRKSSQTYFILGVVYEALRDYSKAESNFNKAIELHPGYTEAWYGLAKTNFDQKKIEDSYYYVNKSLLLNQFYQPAMQLKDQLEPLIKD